MDTLKQRLKKLSKTNGDLQTKLSEAEAKLSELQESSDRQSNELARERRQRDKCEAELQASQQQLGFLSGELQVSGICKLPASFELNCRCHRLPRKSWRRAQRRRFGWKARCRSRHYSMTRIRRRSSGWCSNSCLWSGRLVGRQLNSRRHERNCMSRVAASRIWLGRLSGKSFCTVGIRAAYTQKKKQEDSPFNMSFERKSSYLKRNIFLCGISRGERIFSYYKRIFSYSQKRRIYNTKIYKENALTCGFDTHFCDYTTSWCALKPQVLNFSEIKWLIWFVRRRCFITVKTERRSLIELITIRKSGKTSVHIHVVTIYNRDWF